MIAARIDRASPGRVTLLSRIDPVVAAKGEDLARGATGVVVRGVALLDRRDDSVSAARDPEAIRGAGDAIGGITLLPRVDPDVPAQGFGRPGMAVFLDPAQDP